MCEYRSLSLPKMSRKAFLLTSGALLATCVAAGTGMRLSLTDYNAHPLALDGLRFYPSPSTMGMVSLYGAQDVQGQLSELGLNPGDYSSDEARELLSMAGETIEDMSSTIVTGVFTGERRYVCQSFLCTIRVTGAFKGKGSQVGDDVLVFDPFLIRQPGTFSDSGGIFTDERVVSASADCFNNGTAPLRPSQEYLFFLNAKSYPEGLDAESEGEKFVLVNHPYARIPLDAADHPERSLVIRYEDLPTVEHDGITEYVMPEMTFADACQYDMFVQDETIGEAYRQTCDAIASRVMGS